jgi:predicted RNA-binding protein (virulence factor B family)
LKLRNFAPSNIHFMPIELGRFNTLKVVKEVEFGLYLDGGEEGEILLPQRYVPVGCEIGDMLRVFLYLDQEERLVATTQTPLVQVGEFACLEVAWVNPYGAFLHWGLLKDLFVPFSEQRTKMEVGKSYVVHVHLDDESYRIVASAKIDRYLSNEPAPYTAGDAVKILIWQKSDLGFKVIIENRYGGLLYDNEIFRTLHIGDRLTAYIKQIRTDGKIDVALQTPGMNKVTHFAQTLLLYIDRQGGVIAFNDNSPAEAIYNTFGVSKKTFKKAVGELYRKRLIRLEGNRIVRVEGE